MMAQATLREVRAVFFDAVGTVIHPEPPAATVYAEVGRRHGSRLSEDEIHVRFASAFCREEERDKVAGWRTSEEREVQRWRSIVATVLDDVSDAEDAFRQLFQHFGRPSAWRCAEDVAQTLQGLRQRGLHMGLASNYDKRLRSVVAGMSGLADVTALAISSEIGWRKPAAQFYDVVGHVFHLSPQQVLMVGDDPVNDYEGARKAGLQAVLFEPQEKRLSRGLPRIRRLGDVLALTFEDS